MEFTNLRNRYRELLDYLKKEEYTESYIRRVQVNIRWILKTENQESWQSYVDVYFERVKKSESERYKKDLRVVFGAIQQFDLYGEYPNRKKKCYFIKRSNYHHLVPEFKELIDIYKASAECDGIKNSSIASRTSCAASFLYFMQEMGIDRLSGITEEDVLSFFVDNEGNVSKSSGYKNMIVSVLNAGMGWKEKECRNLIAYLPAIRTKRKNIQFFTPKEAEAIHALLNDECSVLSLRDRAIGKLLFFVGMRACDIAGMEFGSIDWKADKIYILQQKTGQPLTIPLTASIGNSIYDYLVNGRPKNSDSHLFLEESYPHYPLSSDALRRQMNIIYKATSIRQEKGDRRGTHLFRYNVATSFLGSGVPRPVISQTLGHVNPLSLDIYLNADFVHLKEYALSIDMFPIGEEVLCHEPV